MSYESFASKIDLKNDSTQEIACLLTLTRTFTNPHCITSFTRSYTYQSRLLPPWYEVKMVLCRRFFFRFLDDPGGSGGDPAPP